MLIRQGPICVQTRVDLRLDSCKADGGFEKMSIVYIAPNWRQTVPNELMYTLEVINGGYLMEEIAHLDLLDADESGSSKTHGTIGTFPMVAEVKDNHHPSI
uniref:PLAT domain-containing protein n=1 Tax=Panagrellus redivivus TaxID=6233 RepID=A0A7E4WAY3_PANRE